MIIEQDAGFPRVTKDGVTVARIIELPDKFENVGAMLLKEATIKVNDTVGDSTTTATVLAQAIINEGMKAINKGINSNGFEKGNKPSYWQDN